MGRNFGARHETPSWEEGNVTRMHFLSTISLYSSGVDGCITGQFRYRSTCPTADTESVSWHVNESVNRMVIWDLTKFPEADGQENVKFFVSAGPGRHCSPLHVHLRNHHDF